MSKYDTFIQRVEAEGGEATGEAKAQWEEVRNGVRRVQNATAIVEPLVKSKWDQGAPYWNLCPYNTTVGRAYTGWLRLWHKS